MKTALLAILLFFIMIFPHELGHFIAAKRLGIQVNEFAFGMGPIIWKKQRGETLHTIRLLPLGGFCAMEGEDGASVEKGEAKFNPRAFNNKSPLSRIIVLFSGSLMNIFCAFIIMTLIIGIAGFSTTVVGEVKSESPAFSAELKVGDKILSVDGNEIENWAQVGEYISASEGSEIEMIVSRDGEETALSIKPEYSEETQKYAVGILPKASHNPIMAIGAGFKATGNLFKVMFDSLKMLFTGGASVDDISGPVGIVKMVSETRTYGLWYFGFLIALISINLAVINMLPLPALDGGRIIIIIFSMITGKKVSQKLEGTIHAVGMVLLLALMAYVTFNDVGRLIG